MEWMLINLFQTVFMVFGMIVACWFSRWREFRADAGGGAKFAGRDHMLSALRALKAIQEAGAEHTRPAATGGSGAQDFGSHRRIARVVCIAPAAG